MDTGRKSLEKPSGKAVSLLKRNNVAVFISKSNIREKSVTSLHKIIRVPRRMLWAFMLEGAETRKMLNTFARKGKSYILISTATETPSEEELREAISQLKDLPKFLPFVVFITMPVPGITEGYVLLAFTLEKWLGRRFSLLPTQFRKIFQKEEDNEGENDGN